ncbi:MAG: cytochrome o ubiquinol oxidase subunit IV [Chlamydiae bacterium]|nr:cytochrome o ubiquinol oxidase subunit IV [Chlamydiota bacterium]
MIDRNHGWNVSVKPVVLGFILSFFFTVALYRIADRHHLMGTTFAITIFSIAMVQTLIQLVFFMQVGMESKPRWVSISLLFAILVIIIVIGGSIWIMNNLNYNMMPMDSMPTHGAF